MRMRPLLQAACTGLILSAALAGCSDSESVRAFGSNASASSTSSTDTTETEEEEEETSTALPPESYPTASTRSVALNNRAHASFDLDEASISYIYVTNPDQQAFDVWLMDEDEYDDYENARSSLPESADSSHANYKAEYGIDLGDSLSSSVPTSNSLVSGTYHLVIDNTDLGSNSPFNDEAITYEIWVYVNGSFVLTSDDISNVN